MCKKYYEITLGYKNKIGGKACVILAKNLKEAQQQAKRECKWWNKQGFGKHYIVSIKAVEEFWRTQYDRIDR